MTTERTVMIKAEAEEVALALTSDIAKISDQNEAFTIGYAMGFSRAIDDTLAMFMARRKMDAHWAKFVKGEAA